ncbi:hypothetical protein ACHAPD_007260 [Fusarium lateritium]
MSPPMPPKQPGAGVGAGPGDPLPVVGSDRPQTPVNDGGVWKMQGLGPLKYPSFATSSNLVPT